MEHGERPDLVAGSPGIIEPRAPRTHNAALNAQHCATCRPAEANQELRIGEIDLLLNKGQADLGLLRCRGSIARRPPRNDIGDVHLFSIQSDRAQHAIQQLPCSTDERPTYSIFILPRSFTYKHNP